MPVRTSVLLDTQNKYSQAFGMNKTPMLVSQYGVGVSTETGQEFRFITISCGLLSVNVGVSQEDWEKIVRISESAPRDDRPPPGEDSPFAAY